MKETSCTGGAVPDSRGVCWMRKSPPGKLKLWLEEIEAEVFYCLTGTRCSHAPSSKGHNLLLNTVHHTVWFKSANQRSSLNEGEKNSSCPIPAG